MKGSKSAVTKKSKNCIFFFCFLVLQPANFCWWARGWRGLQLLRSDVEDITIWLKVKCTNLAKDPEPMLTTVRQPDRDLQQVTKAVVRLQPQFMFLKQNHCLFRLVFNIALWSYLKTKRNIVCVLIRKGICGSVASDLHC